MRKLREEEKATSLYVSRSRHGQCHQDFTSYMGKDTRGTQCVGEAQSQLTLGNKEEGHGFPPMNKKLDCF